MQYFYDLGYVTDYPDYFGGCYIEDDKLHIRLVNPSDEDVTALSRVLDRYADVVVYENGEMSMADLQAYADETVDELGLLANRIGNDMAMRMVRLIMERGIPSKIFQRNVHGLCHGGGLAAEHIPPDFTFIEAQTNGILTADGENLRHEDAFVFRDFFCHSIEINGNVRIGKEAVSAEPFRTGAVGNVADIVLPLSDPVEVIFDGAGDKLRGIAFVGHGEIVLILMAVGCFREVFQDLIDEILLRFRHRKRLPCVIDLIHIVPLGNVFDEIAVVLFRSGLDVPPFQNHFCHMRYPLLSVGSGHQESVMDSPQR